MFIYQNLDFNTHGRSGSQLPQFVRTKDQETINYVMLLLSKCTWSVDGDGVDSTFVTRPIRSQNV